MDPADPQLFSPLAYFFGRVAEDTLDIAADVGGSPVLVRCPGYAGQIIDKSPEFLLTPAQHLLGALPLAFSYGNGGELRGPLGISIVGGLIVSQVLTLYTTPVLYVYLDRLQTWGRRQWPRRWSDAAAGEASP